MVTPNPAASAAAGPTPKETPKETPAPGPTPKAEEGRAYKVESKHDWCVVKAANEGEARQKWHEFFGIKGTQHEVSVSITSQKPGEHSGQATANTKVLTGENTRLREPAKAV